MTAVRSPAQGDGGVTPPPREPPVANLEVIMYPTRVLDGFRESTYSGSVANYERPYSIVNDCIRRRGLLPADLPASLPDMDHPGVA